MNAVTTFFAATARGVEPILEEELRSIGAAGIKLTGGGMHFSGTLETAMRACLWSRSASRILFPLGRFSVSSAGEIYDAVRALPWEDHLPDGATMAVNFSGTGAGITNTMFGAQRVKDAVVDRLRDLTGRRPSVETAHPGFRVNCHLSRGELEVRIDLSGDSLHQRGYRREGRLAPLKENLAAALLIKSEWPMISREGGAFLDPLCGSGTLVIEAAMIAADAAPGLLRERWGFQGWTGHDPALWNELVAEARARLEDGLQSAPRCVGYDMDGKAVAAAVDNARRAGVGAIIHFEKKELAGARPGAKLRPGLILTNPPYGKRLGEKTALKEVYAGLGDTLKKYFTGWRAAVFTGEPGLGKRMGLRARKVNAFYNGSLPCQLLQFTVEREWFVDREAIDEREAGNRLRESLERGADAFMNRLKKNRRALVKWADREGIECYRLYDADLPEYAVAVDVFGGWARVYEYAPPSTIDAVKSSQRLQDALTVTAHVLEIDGERVILKRRKRTGEGRGSGGPGSGMQVMEVKEGQCRFLVSINDSIDDGLSPDRRSIRVMVGSMAGGKKFLNLFCGSAAASVYAALGGAVSTHSVDSSGDAVQRAENNMELNGVRGTNHRVIREDPVQWMSRCRERFGLIYVDPPGFIASNGAEGAFDIQRDHAGLINGAAKLLTRDGVILFCAGTRKFRIDAAALAGLTVEDITLKTVPIDFKRNPRIHQCFRITLPAVHFP